MYAIRSYYEDREAEGCDQLALAVEGVLHAAVDEIDDHLNHNLGLPRYAGSSLPRDAAEQPDEQQAKQHRPEHRVDVDRHRVARAMVPDPLTRFRLADLEVLQMVRNVFAGGLRSVSARGVAAL